jgi:hypothetical protein
MAALSVSLAWEETKVRIVADGRLMMVVAAALIAFPALISGVVSPATAEADSSLAGGLLLLVASLLAVIGQLSLIRLAIGPSVSVGEAIGHGARRMPIYIVSGLIVALALVIAAIPLFVILAAAGVPIEQGSAAAEQALRQSPVALLLLILYVALVIFVGIRMLMASPVASEEAVGPIEIIRRSWALTAGHWWRLFGFLVLFFLGAGVTMAAINWAVAFVAVMLLGPIEPMSAAALVVALIDAVVNAAITVVLAVMLARMYLQLAGRGSLDVSVPRSGT